MSDLDELERVAKDVQVSLKQPDRKQRQDAWAALISTANPTTILALVAEVRRLKALNSRASDLLESLRRVHYESFNKDDDALLAELKEAASE